MFMRMAELFLSYERPKGRDPGQAQVLVRANLVEEAGGVPEVDYENLTRMFSGEQLNFNPDRLPVASLYFSEHPSPEAMNVPLNHAFRIGRVLHVNAFDNERSSGDQIDSELVMERLIQRAAIYARSRAGELPDYTPSQRVKLRVAMAGVGLLGYGLVTSWLPAEVPGVLMSTVGLSFLDERAAHLNKLVAPMVDMLMGEHSQDITFPKQH